MTSFQLRLNNQEIHDSMPSFSMEGLPREVSLACLCQGHNLTMGVSDQSTSTPAHYSSERAGFFFFYLFNEKELNPSIQIRGLTVL